MFNGTVGWGHRCSPKLIIHYLLVYLGVRKEIPPYHSKYNPVEHCWAILEQQWNGDLLDSVDTAVEFAKTMT